MRRFMVKLPSLRRGINHPVSFSLHLTVKYILSTFLPFMLITYFLVRLIIFHQTQDILRTTQSHLASLARNVSIYLTELQQVTLMPYYDENFSYYLSQSNESQTLSFLEKQKIRQSLRNTIDFIRFTRSDIQNVVIVNNQNCLFYSTELLNAIPQDGYDYEKEDWYQQAIAADGKVLMVPVHRPAYFGEDSLPVFSLVRSLVNLQTRVPYAVIKVDATTAVFEQFLHEVDFYVAGNLYLFDSNQHLIYTNAADEEDRAWLVSNAAEGEDQIRDGGVTLLHQSVEAEPFGWQLHVLIDQSAVFDKQQIVYGAAFSLYLVGVALALVSYLGLSRKMVRSIASISECMESLTKGNFQKRYVPIKHDELAFLGDKVNDMARQLDELIQREYVSTMRRQEAEMRALQAQIRPHFLFNTISGLIALNQLHKTDELENALFSLSSLLRYVVHSETMVTLNDELKFARHYFELQKLRFGNKFDYVIRCDGEKTLQLRLPRLLLQPYWENAIIHGVEPCQHHCVIATEVSHNGQNVTIVIEDDGVGFDADSGRGVGMLNSEKRLQAIYPTGHVVVYSMRGQGCRITLQIPEADV